MSTFATPGDWQRLGRPAPDRLVDTRLQQHWAAQVVGAVGFTYVPAVPDYSHTNLEWMPARSALASKPATVGATFRAALRLHDLTLLVLDGDDAVAAALELHGQTLDAAYAWLAEQLHEMTSGAAALDLIRPEHELPSHAVGSGAAFARHSVDAFEEMSRWFANADRLVRAFQAVTANASPVRCWPHHFDIATFVLLDPERPAEEARSMNVGMAPGDDSYAEPYFYVSPWPRPAKTSQLVDLDDGGAWHTRGWLGAVLTGSQLVEHDTPEAQARAAARYMQSAVAACRTLLDVHD